MILNKKKRSRTETILNLNNFFKDNIKRDCIVVTINPNKFCKEFLRITGKEIILEKLPESKKLYKVIY